MKGMEKKRLSESRESKKPWKKWGPYLSERQWGTVREDYSVNGDAWNFFHTRSGTLTCLPMGRGWYCRDLR